MIEEIKNNNEKLQYLVSFQEYLEKSGVKVYDHHNRALNFLLGTEYQKSEDSIADYSAFKSAVENTQESVAYQLGQLPFNTDYVAPTENGFKLFRENWE
jgi:hypothetical protein